jgi:hypothetical protein
MESASKPKGFATIRCDGALMRLNAFEVPVPEPEH